MGRAMHSMRGWAVWVGLGAGLGLAGCGGSGSTPSGSGGEGGSTPTPAVSSISPTSVPAGSGPVTLTVNGSGFVASSVVQVNGASESTTYVSSAKLTATVPAAQIAVGKELAVAVLNGSASSGGGTPLNLEVDNPAPTIGSLSPTAEVLNAGSLSVSVTGTGFVTSTVVNVNGSARATTVSSATAAQVTLTAADVATAGTLMLTAVNPTPGGGTSAAVPLPVGITTPTPTIVSVSPDQVLEGSGDTQITVTGTGFSNSSVVYWNGAALGLTGVTGSMNGTMLTATVPAADFAATGTGSVTVSTPTANPSLSNAMKVTVYAYPVPKVTSISPALTPLNTPVTVTVMGSGFTRVSVIAINGVAQPTTYLGETSLSADVPASLLSAPGVLSFTVTTPTPGGGTSAAQYFTAYVPVVNNSMVYDAANGLFYLSVPSAAGAPYGNCVVSVDPVTGALGKPIPVGSEPNRMAITADGKALWVALDGGAAVRKVDLTTGTAGMQFSIVNGQDTVAALAALPGAPDSVVVSTYFGGYTENTGANLAIYDSGVARSATINFDTYAPFPWALIVDAANSEIYGPGNVYGDYYNTYHYDGNGITLKSSKYTGVVYAQSNTDDVAVAGGRLYTDNGSYYDPESGALLGTFYSSGATAAQGSIAIDANLGLAFVLEGYWGSDSMQLQAFHLADASATTATPIAMGNPTFRASYQWAGSTGNRLTRWGADGLAYRSTGGFMSLRTGMVKDLSSTNADLKVVLAVSGAKSAGSATIYTATVTNQGPNAASSVRLMATMPQTGVLSGTTGGSCSGTATVVCDLGSLSKGASAPVTFTVQQASAGTAAMSVQVSASENDPTPSDDAATSSLTITGADVNLVPVLAGVSPQAVVSGSSDTTITVTGANFAGGATVLLNGNALATTAVSSSELQATVPAADLKNLGWAAVAVMNPTPGGGTSNMQALTVFSTMTLGANAIVYDPYARKIMAAVSTGSATVAANSIVAIDPTTKAVGTPAAVGATPTEMALSDDGNVLYALAPGESSAAVVRYNMQTQRVDFPMSGFQTSGYEEGLRDLAVQPGSENTIAVDEGEYPGISIFDIDPVKKTATRRGVATGLYTGTCLAFPDANHLLSIDLYGSGYVLDDYSVTANGLVNGQYPYAVRSSIQYGNCYKLTGNLLVTESGGVASTSTVPLTQLGVIEGLTIRTNYGTGVKDFDADSSLGLAYYLTNSAASEYNQPFDSISGYDLNTYMPASSVVLPFATLENGLGYTAINVVRWGQDGLAVLTNDTLYFVRGPAVTPGLLKTNTAAALDASSAQSVAHGAGNTLLTLTGTHFLPGVAVLWNGNYRTTTIADAQHVRVAVPASDLGSAGSATVVAVNPGAPASNAVTVTIN